MKATEIRIGETYRAGVSGKDARVKITAERTSYNGQRYWLAQNLATKREVTIRGAARLHPINNLQRWFMVLGDGRKVATWAPDEDAARAKSVRLGHTVTAIASTAAGLEDLIRKPEFDSDASKDSLMDCVNEETYPDREEA